ncbi:MAG: phytoene desaturase [Novosphingobium sp.]
MSAQDKSACIVGAGFGGLALAVRLQAAGIATTLVEARDRPGGVAYAWEKDGFTFDGGPTAIIDPHCLEELWQLTGHEMADDVELMPVSPFCRCSWPDGTSFDYSDDEASLRHEIARISLEDLGGYDEFLAYARKTREEAYETLGHTSFLTLKAMIRAAPMLVWRRGWRSLHALVSRYMKSEKLREAFSIQAIMFGGNPMRASGLYALVHDLEKRNGVWWVRGGTNRLAEAMLRHFRRLGGSVRLHDPVIRIHTLGNRVREVETQSGWRGAFDAVASNADLMHTYRDLLGETRCGPRQARRLAMRSYSPGLFMVHFGVEGSWPGIPHHSVLFGPRYRGLFDDIFNHGVLPRDFVIHLHHPTVTDPSVAPAGKSTFRALVPVAHMGKLAIDWEQVGPMLEKRILDEVGRRLIPDIHDRIVTSFHYAPRDFAMDLNAYLGSAFSLEPRLTQSGWLRPHNRDAAIPNFYLVGAGTHPGAGIPAVIAGARVTAQLMLDDMAR